MSISIENIKAGSIPNHVAEVMDGNGRWAKKSGVSRSKGHEAGADVIEPLIDQASDLGIKVVSLYAFSTENWKRSASEIASLWKLLEYFFSTKLDSVREKGVKIVHSGSLKKLPPFTKRAIINAVESTKKNKKIILNLCVNYGGQQEIVDSVNSWLESSKPNEKLTMKKLEKRLYVDGLKPVDLLIRTSGEYRISNFLLWQIAYAEMLFMDILWPDFRPKHLVEAIDEFQKRERRFGGV